MDIKLFQKAIYKNEIANYNKNMIQYYKLKKQTKEKKHTLSTGRPHKSTDRNVFTLLAQEPNFNLINSH